MLAATPHRKDPLMSTPTPPDQPDQGITDVPPDQGITDVPPDQGVSNVPGKSRTTLLVGIGAAIVVVIGIIAAVFH